MIAYLINQYPQTSQTFIRREIFALEKLGIQIARFTLRRSENNLVDEADLIEQKKTKAVLDEGPVGLALAVSKNFIRSPFTFIKTVFKVLRIGSKSQRGIFVHCVYLAEACILIDWFRDINVKHVHCHFGTNSATVALLIRSLGGPPYSFTIHGPEEWDGPWALSIAEKIADSRFCCVVSDFGRSQAYRWSRFKDWQKIHVIRCGIDEQFLTAPSIPPPVHPRLVCVGRLGETKGQLILLEAAAVLNRAGVEFEILLIGDGPLRSEIEEFVLREGLNQRVKLLGWQSGQSIRDTILRSRAMVLSSFAEGLPVVFMESLALERPVITTWIAGTPELIKDGVNGWLVPAGSVLPLADAMVKALFCPIEELWKMGKVGKELVLKNHSCILEAEKLAALMEAKG